jgi:hypothetical protein
LLGLLALLGIARMRKREEPAALQESSFLDQTIQPDSSFGHRGTQKIDTAEMPSFQVSVMESPTGHRFCVVRRKNAGSSALERWHRIVAARDITDLDDLIADEAVFESPAVHTPQVGKAITRKYLAAASRVLMNDSFHYVGEWLGEGSAVLEFKCMLGEIEVDGIDMIEWNDAGRITRFKVMVRPVKALQTLMPLMAAELAKL